MRTNLKRYTGHRMRYTGIFVRFGKKKGFQGRAPSKTLLLKDVKNSLGKIVTGHLWFNYTKGFQELGPLLPGDIIAFEARAKPYIKGYVGPGIDEREADFRLSNPTNIRIIEKEWKHGRKRRKID